jgi:hypothetical protein
VAVRDMLGYVQAHYDSCLHPRHRLGGNTWRRHWTISFTDGRQQNPRSKMQVCAAMEIKTVKSCHYPTLERSNIRRLVSPPRPRQGRIDLISATWADATTEFATRIRR